MNTPNNNSKQSRRKNLVGWILVLIWAPTVTVIISFQMAEHLLTQPVPTKTEQIRQAVSQLRSHGQVPWFLVHIIYDNCTCTNRLLRKLIERGPMTDAEEHILFVGADNKKLAAARKKGFGMTFLDEDTLEQQYHMDSAPIFIVLDENNQIRYLGGYYKRSAAIVSYDRDIFQVVTNNQKADVLPLYGCAVSRKLQELFDPLGIKY